MDTLFLTAAAGEPRFQAARDSSEKILLALGSVTLDWLVDTAVALARPGRDLTPRHRHYVERLFTVMADSGRNPAPRRSLARAVSESSDDTVRAQWLYIGSRMADTAFRAAALPWLSSESEAVRRMAVRSLGAYPDPEHLPLLWSGLDTLRGLERHMRLWALDAHVPSRDPEHWKRLAPLLADEFLFNRQKVRDMLLRATDSSWNALRTALPENPGSTVRKEWRLLARDAREGSGGRAFLEAEKKAMTPEERRFFGFSGN